MIEETGDLRDFYHYPELNRLSADIADWRARKGFYNPKSFADKMVKNESRPHMHNKRA